ncbi:unnamed protein product [Cuscuta epithymum]|uniref:Uncharacterized protein n=1 Tax=Cuscuta epithymum TaxID=186058 RepID=A0AAV0CIZ1_9ASTE|nr:unnamed protein product [Cuscuta epithymum]
MLNSVPVLSAGKLKRTGKSSTEPDKSDASTEPTGLARAGGNALCTQHDSSVHNTLHSTKSPHLLIFHPINPSPPSFLSFPFLLSFPAPNFLLPLPLFLFSPSLRPTSPAFFFSLVIDLHCFPLYFSLLSFYFLSLSPFLHLFSSLFLFSSFQKLSLFLQI